ncbi:HTH-type transcriptional regulator SfaX [Escherichia coli]|uniref:HTH-type transcriptional regulator SfaX n=1 Tax=Escherichia coli TaxID=562 RepID=UPI002543E5C1|nr:HTH-type transcriptional regulator SfaX [Escherichia coli]MDI4304809.1 MarR family transcriptional regulator [Escherichia coli]
MRTCTQAVCFSNMENNEMNNTDTLEKIIRHQKNKDPAYPFREHLLMQLCIRANKRMQDNISEFLGAYGINHSVYMVLTTLFTAESHCLSPSEIRQKLQFTRTNITRITDFLEKTGYVKRTDSREDRRAKKISLTSEGMFFIQRLTLAQSMYLKEIWGYLTHDEQELFEVINKKLLEHLDDVSS